MNKKKAFLDDLSKIHLKPTRTMDLTSIKTIIAYYFYWYQIIWQSMDDFGYDTEVLLKIPPKTPISLWGSSSTNPLFLTFGKIMWTVVIWSQKEGYNRAILPCTDISFLAINSFQLQRQPKGEMNNSNTIIARSPYHNSWLFHRHLVDHVASIQWVQQDGRITY